MRSCWLEGRPGVYKQRARPKSLATVVQVLPRRIQRAVVTQMAAELQSHSRVRERLAVHFVQAKRRN
jgi:hypothetical protein